MGPSSCRASSPGTATLDVCRGGVGGRSEDRQGEYSVLTACGYGSLARGDWDGCSDTDLLVVAANQDAGERVADQLIEDLLGDDLLAIDQERWQAMARSPRPTGRTTPSPMPSCGQWRGTGDET